MSRTLKDIYSEAIIERNKRMELAEFDSDSKLSIMNGLTWVVAAIIHSFESLLDVFAVDISNAINSRVNGTPVYYANALLQYQKGDLLTVRDDGLAFGYSNIDENKRTITQVSYTESVDDHNLDSKLILKIATGDKGNLTAISKEDLIPINTYINKIKFAGTRIEVISYEGDVLVPRLTVFYDGSIPESEIYENIESKLKLFIMNTPFDSSIYVSRIIEAIRSAEHITDVYIDEKANPEQGIFIAPYNNDGHIGNLQKIYRMIKTSSGFLKESSGKGEESNLPNFREAIKLLVE